MVSTIGEFAVSGVNIIDNINNLLIIAFTALSTGGAVVVSQYIGRRDSKNASLAARQLIYAVAIVSLIIMTLALSSRRPIIRLFYGNLEADVMDAAAIYFLFTALSYPFLAIYSSSAAIFRAMGNSKVTMSIALLVNITHITCSAFFIFVLQIGIAGVAISNLLSRILAAVILTILLTNNKSGPVYLTGLFKIHLNPPIMRSILNIGIPSGLENSMFQMGRVFTQRIFTLFGTYALAANAVTHVIASFCFMPGMAYAMALLTVVGQCIGAGDYEAAKRYTAKIMKLSFLTIFVLSLFIYIFMEDLISLFNLSPEAHELAKSFLRLYCFFNAFVWVFSFALPNALRAAGDVRFVMISATISMWTIRVSAAYIMAYFLGVGPISVWIAMGIDMTIRAACFLIRWLKGSWKKKKVIAD